MYCEQLPSGRWRGGFRANGRKFQQTFDYEYEASAWAAHAERRALAAGADGAHEIAPIAVAEAPGMSVTVDEYGMRWLARIRGRLASATRDGYARDLRGIADTGLGSRPINSLRKADVEDWITDQVEDGVGVTTINKRLARLRTVIREAVDDDKVLATHDATVKIKLLKTDIRPARTLDWVEEGRLLGAAADDTELLAMILLALDGGLRWGECAGLGADCVRGDFISVRQVVERHSGNFRRSTKSSEVRIVPTTPRLQAALAPIIAAAVAQRGPQAMLFTAGTPRRPRREPAKVTRAPDGSAMLDYNNWTKQRLNPARAAAKLDEPRPRFHDLRHTYGTRLAAAGVPRLEIAELMGHADERTSGRYIHAGTDGRRRDLVLAALVR